MRPRPPLWTSTALLPWGALSNDTPFLSQTPPPGLAFPGPDPTRQTRRMTVSSRAREGQHGILQHGGVGAAAGWCRCPRVSRCAGPGRAGLGSLTGYLRGSRCPEIFDLFAPSLGSARDSEFGSLGQPRPGGGLATWGLSQGLRAGSQDCLARGSNAWSRQGEDHPSFLG